MRKAAAIIFFVFIGIPVGFVLYIAAEVYYALSPINREYPSIDHDLDESYIRQSQNIIEK